MNREKLAGLWRAACRDFPGWLARNLTFLILIGTVALNLYTVSNLGLRVLTLEATLADSRERVWKLEKGLVDNLPQLLEEVKGNQKRLVRLESLPFETTLQQERDQEDLETIRRVAKALRSER